MQANQIINELRKAGLRITKNRKKITEIFCNSSTPISVLEVIPHLKVNKTTIYREINTLVGLGYLQEIDFSDGIKRYEMADKGHHHHLVCLNCKSVIEFDLHDDFSKEEKLIERKENFKVVKHNLEFFGICSNCN